VHLVTDQIYSSPFFNCQNTTCPNEDGIEIFKGQLFMSMASLDLTMCGQNTEAQFRSTSLTSTLPFWKNAEMGLLLTGL